MANGGILTSNIRLNYNTGGSPNPGELEISDGVFTHPNGTTYDLTETKYVLTCLEGGFYDWRYVIFIGSDDTRFEFWAGGYASQHFVDAKFIDGSWYYYKNDNSPRAFTPNENDCIVAKISSERTGAEIDDIFMYANKDVATNTDLGALDTRVSTAESSITQNANEIALKASQTDLTTLEGDVSGIDTRLATAESTLTVQAGQIATKVTQTEVDTAKAEAISTASSDATSKANTAETNAKSHADSLDSAMNTRMLSAESSITQNADEIALRVTKTEFQVHNYGDTIKTFNHLCSEVRSGGIAGYLVIETPITYNYMTKVTIVGYNYLANKTNFNLEVSFYAYNTGQILQHSYTSTGDFPITKVQVGRVDGKIVIVINESNTSWSYPSIRVEKAQLSFNTAPDSYKDGWSMYFTGNMPSCTDLVILSGKDVQSELTSHNSRLTTAESSITQNANNITLKASQTDLDTLEGRVTTAESSITLNTDNINLKVSKNDVVNQINLSTEGITINANKLNIVGAVTVLSDIAGNLGSITAGTITGALLRTSAGADRIQLDSASTLKTYKANVKRAEFDYDSLEFFDSSGNSGGSITGGASSYGFPTLTLGGVVKVSNQFGAASFRDYIGNWIFLDGYKTLWFDLENNDIYRVHTGIGGIVGGQQKFVHNRIEDDLEFNGSLTIDDNAGGTIGGSNLGNAWLKVGSTLGFDPNEMYFGTTGYIGTTGNYNLHLRRSGADKITLLSTGAKVTGELDVTGNIDCEAELYVKNWIRAEGTTGLYFQSYGGGWRMTDSTYIRNYGSKSLLMEKDGHTLEISGNDIAFTRVGDSYIKGGKAGRLNLVGRDSAGTEHRRYIQYESSGTSMKPNTNNTGYNGVDSKYFAYSYAGSHVNKSGIEAKTNIIEYDDKKSYDNIKDLRVYKYNRLIEGLYPDDYQMGILAHEAPMDILKYACDVEDGDFVDLYSYTAMTHSAVRHLSKKVESLENTVVILSQQIKELKGVA